MLNNIDHQGKADQTPNLSAFLFKNKQEMTGVGEEVGERDPCALLVGM